MLERNIVFGTKPSQTWMTVTEFKAWGRISTSAEDALITGMLESASQHVEKLAGKCLVPTPVDIYFDKFPPADYGKPRKLFLGCAPIQSITSMTYIQINTGSPITLTLGTDFFASLNNSNPYVVDSLLTGQGCWPDFDLAWHQPDVIHINAIAGYASQAAIPINFKWAAYQLTLLRYQNREGANPNIAFKDLPNYASTLGLIGPYIRNAI